MPDAANDGSEVFGAYIQKELDRQIERKASLEQRALSVITTSGALVTLLFGLAALSTKQQTFVLPSRSKDLLLVSLVFFVIAIAGALAINVPLVYKHVTPEGLADAVSNRWNRQPSSARKTVARTQIDVFKSARKINGVKAWLLFGAIGAELVAVGLVAAAVGVVIYGQKPVTPSNAFAIVPGVECRPGCGLIRMRVVVAGAGSLAVEQATRGPSARAQLLVYPATTLAVQPGPVTLTLVPTRTAINQIASHGLTMGLRVAFTPTGGTVANEATIVSIRQMRPPHSKPYERDPDVPSASGS